MAASNEFSDIDLNVKIEKYQPSIEEIESYVKAQHQALENGSYLTLNEYLKENTEHKGSRSVIIADLTNMEINDYDLTKSDFTGCILDQTSFINCKLDGAVFCDTDLDGTHFLMTSLKSADFRGTNLATTKFGSDYYTDKESVEGIKFSTSSALVRQYADVKLDVHREEANRELLEQIKKENNQLANEIEEKNKNIIQKKTALFLYSLFPHFFKI